MQLSGSLNLLLHPAGSLDELGGERGDVKKAGDRWLHSANPVILPAYLALSTAVL